MKEDQRKLLKWALTPTDNNSRHHRGCTVAQAKERLCPCGGNIKTDRSNSIQVSLHLSEECPGCVELLIDHLACIAAGGAATSLLEHGTAPVDLANSARNTLSETRHDRQEADRILSGLVKNEQRRREVKEKAQQRAASWAE